MITHSHSGLQPFCRLSPVLCPLSSVPCPLSSAFPMRLFPTLFSALLLAFSFFSLPVLAFEPGQLVIGQGEKAQHFQIEIAEKKADLEQGLMFRDALAPHAGMLFLFANEEIANMWMRNTRIPLDMLFMDGKGTIVSIAENARPYDETIISSRVPCRAALEIGGGQAAALGIKVGDKVTWQRGGGSTPSQPLPR